MKTERTMTVIYKDKMRKAIEELATVKHLLHKGHTENALVILFNAVEFMYEAIETSHQQIEQLQDHMDF
jgi:hypothetical protein